MTEDNGTQDEGGTPAGDTANEERVVASGDLISVVKELIHEGNVRHIILKGEDGSVLFDLPLNAGLGVTALTLVVAPALIAIGAIAAVVTKVTLVIERDEKA